jgi:dienelactone hydrolase
VRAIAEAKRLFSIDEDRVYLTGDSMGGWGTWNIASRHPQLFAAIAPVFGGKDYHSVMSEEELGRLRPVERFLQEEQSTWSMAESLLNLPIIVRHGDQDQVVSVEYSRWATRLLQRWGYDVRYHEYPGRRHEALESQGNASMSIPWFLSHRRDANPSRVRVRSADLRYATAYWAEVRQGGTPLDFMVLDAEVVDRNVIRLDTHNVVAVALSPSAPLVDPAKPVRVVWNGRSQTVSWQQGKLELAAPGYAPGPLHKHPLLPGTMADFTTTPFAVVIGTVAKDPEMVALCQEKAAVFVDSWRDWQKQEPRVFKDTEIGPADVARYSLLLVGGPEANRVTAQLAAQLPLRVSKNRITLGGNAFPVEDAAVQMLYPNPRNPDRYVWVVAGSSANGMYFNSLNPQARPDCDYFITDGRLPARQQPASLLQMQVVSGLFDRDWRFSKDLAVAGDAQLRAKGRIRHRPKPNFRVPPELAASYVGRYQLEKGPVFEVAVEGGNLVLRPAGGGDTLTLVPETETSFSVPMGDLWLSFTRDASGKVTGLGGYHNGDFAAKKLD